MNYTYLFITLLLLKATMVKPDYIVMTMLYNEQNSNRRQEYIECLERNLQHSLIKHIHIIYDRNSDHNDPKKNELYNFLSTKNVTITSRNGRASYQDFFELANRLYPNQKIVICNADIYFNETLHNLDSVDLTNTFIALTRYELLPTGQLIQFFHPDGKKHEDSQDVWIFQAPIRLFGSDVYLGVPYCDSEIAYYAHAHGYTVINPYYSIQSCHLHLSRVRHWQDRPYPKNMMVVPWTALSTGK